jgi:hypothetical protein
MIVLIQFQENYIWVCFKDAEYQSLKIIYASNLFLDMSEILSLILMEAFKLQF